MLVGETGGGLVFKEERFLLKKIPPVRMMVKKAIPPIRKMKVDLGDGGDKGEKILWSVHDTL